MVWRGGKGVRDVDVNWGRSCYIRAPPSHHHPHLWDTHDHCGAPVAGKELSQDRGVGVGVVAADDAQAIQREALANGSRPRKLLGRLDLVTPAANGVKACRGREAPL